MTSRAPVPTNTRYKTATPAPESDPAATGGNLSWKLNTLKGGQRREIVLVVEPTGGDEIVCRARVTFEHGE